MEREDGGIILGSYMTLGIKKGTILCIIRYGVGRGIILGSYMTLGKI